MTKHDDMSRPDPQAQGLPDTADPDSSADTPTATDNPDPPSLPSDTPMVLDEPLGQRLRREEPDIHDDAEAPVTMEDLEAPPVQARPDSPASQYDTAGAGGEQVGRLAEPGGEDPLAGPLTARDAGTAGGGLTAEEQAMHVEPPD